jgi:predicted enzyme related to lactoylglutathione lyase
MIKEIAFVVYAVTDVPRSREFYEKLLGLKTGPDNFGDKWIEYDITGAAFVITDAFPIAAPASSVALEVDDLDAEVSRLKAAGVKFSGEVSDFPSCRMALICDPDDNTICLHQRKS